MKINKYRSTLLQNLGHVTNVFVQNKAQNESYGQFYYKFVYIQSQILTSIFLPNEPLNQSIFHCGSLTLITNLITKVRGRSCQGNFVIDCTGYEIQARYHQTLKIKESQK